MTSRPLIILPGHIAAEAQAEDTPTAESVRAEIRKYMVLPEDNDHLVDLILAVALSLNLDKPVWLMVMAPPSCGKTELLRIISSVKGYHQISNLTSRFLFSGHPAACGGYMIRAVGAEGIMAFPDFTTVLSMNPNMRKEVFNQLRVVFDGEAGLGTGIDNGESRIWRGKVAVIASVTETMERFKERASDLGERFLYYRFYPKADGVPIRPSPEASRARDEVPEMVKDLLQHLTPEMSKASFGDDEFLHLRRLAEFIARGRAVVDRDGHSRQIRLAHEPEAPYRLETSLRNLYLSLTVLNRGDKDRAMKIVGRVCESTLPVLRMRVIDYVGGTREPANLGQIEVALGYPSDALRRTVEDLLVQRVLVSTDHRYSLEASFAERWRVLRE